MIEIVVETEGQPARSLRFDQPRIRVGREAGSDVVVDSPGCSRRHAEILADGDRWRIVDLGSTNGLVVSNRRVTELTLSHGTAVTVGQTRLTFHLPEAPSDRTMRLELPGLEGGATAAISLTATPRALPMPPMPATPSGAPPPMPLPAAPSPRPTPTAVPQGQVLYLISGIGDRERSLKLVPGGEYVIGRGASADLSVDDDQSSKQHAKVIWRDGRFHLVDLGSANGTWVADQRITEVPLSIGDRILIGRSEIHVEDQIARLADQDHLLGRTRMGIPLPGYRGTSAAAPAAGTATAGAGRRPKTAIVVAAVVLGLLGLFAAGAWLLGKRLLGGGAEAPVAAVSPAAPGEAIVRLAAVTNKTLVLGLDGTGNLEADRSAALSAEIPGRVLAVPVAEGGAVEQGTLLVQLNDRDIQNQLAEARSAISRDQVQLARDDYQRKQRLYDQGALVRSLLDMSKNNYLTLDAAYKTAQARVAQLQEQLTKTRIAAPFAGRLVDVLVDPGEFVGPGMPVAMVEDSRSMLVRINLSDRDVVRVKPGQRVDATTDAHPGRNFSGEVTRVGTAAHPVTRTFEVEARLPNPDGALRSGMIAKLRIVENAVDAVVVPLEAVLQEPGGGAAVFKVVDGVARRTVVRLGERHDREAQVIDGLVPGDQVVVYGQSGLADGQAIRSSG